MAASARSRNARAAGPKRSSSASKRRPTARRRPAARRGGSRVRWDRVGRVALTLVLAAVLYSYLNPAINLVKTYTATTAAKAEFHEMLRENKRLHRRIQSADDPAEISRRARAQGMVAEGETPVVVRGLGG
jgi:cell division protein FtsB